MESKSIQADIIRKTTTKSVPFHLIEIIHSFKTEKELMEYLNGNTKYCNFESGSYAVIQGDAKQVRVEKALTLTPLEVYDGE